MTDEMYGTLAAVYDWLVPDALLAPAGSVAAFAQVVDGLGSGARVLDCAAGTGHLAVGLALRGFRVVATDASSAMIQRTRGTARASLGHSWLQTTGLGLAPRARPESA